MNNDHRFVLVHDVGTTGNKACLYRLGKSIELVDSHLVEYPLYILENGGVEQKADEWWAAITESTKKVIQQSGITPDAIQGMAFCAQMQGFIPVDQNGVALRNPLSYMDSRSSVQIERYLYDGLIKINGWNAFKLLRWLQVTGGAAATVKDPLWKYLWVHDNEPDVFAAMHRWMDVKDYLVLRSTGEFAMGYDSAHATFLFDTRPGKLEWHEGLCRTFDVDLAHLPKVIGATDVAGKLQAGPAKELGLPAGLPIFGGGGDLSLIAVGSGVFDVNATHIYIGTSGWVASNVDKRMTDINGMVASILGAIPGCYNYISELETAGRCLQWVRDHLALDEIGVYLGETAVSSNKETEQRNLYHLLNRVVDETRPGSNGTIFTPWLHGNRSPFEDPLARGMFFNIGLETGKRHLIRSVLEGVAYHKRWMVETIEKKVPQQGPLRFVGGGAQSDVWAQILADVTGRQIEVVADPQNSGALGAAIVCAVGLGVTDFNQAEKMIDVAKSFAPQSENCAVYEKQYQVFKQLHKKNKKLFKTLNG